MRMSICEQAGCLLIALAALIPDAAKPQEARPEAAPIRGVLRRLSDSTWKNRRDAFYGLIGGAQPDIGGSVKELLQNYPDEADSISLALIGLLERENAALAESARRGEKIGRGEEYSDYYANVIWAVTSLKDIRSMDALIGAIATGGMVTRTLAEFAPQSVEAVLARTADPDPHVRSSTLAFLCEMLSPPYDEKVGTPGFRSKIKEAFLRGVKDKEGVVRAVAVRGLGALGDPDVIPIVAHLAEHDPDHYPSRYHPGGRRYWVRESATKALEELRAKTRKAQ